MPITPNYSLPYPAYGNAADGPDAIGDLATAVDTALQGKAASGHTHTTATLPVGSTASDVAAGDHTHTTLPSTKPYFTSVSVTTDSNGEVTITHGCPFTPASGAVSVAVAEADSGPIVGNLIAGSFTSTTVRGRFKISNANYVGSISKCMLILW